MCLSVITVCTFFVLWNRRPPRATLTNTLFPYSTLCRSARARLAAQIRPVPFGRARDRKREREQHDQRDDDESRGRSGGDDAHHEPDLQRGEGEEGGGGMPCHSAAETPCRWHTDCRAPP